MYKVNDLIFYSNTGICRIKDITMLENASFDENQFYYVLEPVYGNGVIYAPTYTKAFMRHIISPEEAERLIDMISTMQAEPYYNDRMQELKQHYEALVKTHDCGDLIELAMSTYAKKELAQQTDRKFGQIDERFMKQAEDLLYGEVSLALAIPKDKVQEYIAAKVAAKVVANSKV